jgi:hypothetical protein
MLTGGLYHMLIIYFGKKLVINSSEELTEFKDEKTFLHITNIYS